MQKISNIILDTQPRLSKLMQGQELIEKIKQTLQKIDLFTKHKQHYRVIKYSQSIVYLSVSTAAFATQIRHSSVIFLQTLRREIPEIEFNAIQCKVSVTPIKSTKEITYEKNKARIISTKIKNKLMALAENIHAEELSEALKKLTT